MVDEGIYQAIWNWPDKMSLLSDGIIAIDGFRGISQCRLSVQPHVDALHALETWQTWRVIHQMACRSSIPCA